MASYPDAALRLQNELNQMLVPTSGSLSFSKHAYAGSSLEEAAEGAVARVIEQYTRVADRRACNTVTVWNILGNGGYLHGSDFSLAITSGPNTSSMQLTITVSDSGSGEFTLLLYDYSIGGEPTQWKGSIGLDVDDGYWILTPYSDDTPKPPAPAYPNYNSSDAVQL